MRLKCTITSQYQIIIFISYYILSNKHNGFAYAIQFYLTIIPVLASKADACTDHAGLTWIRITHLAELLWFYHRFRFESHPRGRSKYIITILYSYEMKKCIWDQNETETVFKFCGEMIGIWYQLSAWTVVYIMPKVQQASNR